MSTTITPATALAHKRLYPRVTALLKQVERGAARHLDHPVPGAIRGVAKSLFAEARKILGREVGRMAGTARADLSALAVGLSQLVAGPEAFVAENASFSYELRRRLGCAQGPYVGQPVEAGRPREGISPVNVRKSADDAAFRARVGRRIDEINIARYITGYRDGKAGRPPLPPFHGDASQYPAEDQPTYPRA